MTEEYMNPEGIQVLDSVEKVNDEINLLEILKTLKRRWIPFSVAFSGIVITTGILTSLQTPIFQSKGQILISKTNEASALTGLAEELSADPLSKQSNPIETEIQVVRSSPILEKVITSLDLKNQNGVPLTVDEFRKRLQTSVVQGTDVLEVSFKDPSPQIAAEAVNTVMQVYIKNDIEVNRSQTTAARQFISQQIPRSERQLSEAEAKLRQFKEDYGVLELAVEAQELVARLADLKASIVNSEAQLVASKEKSQQLQNHLGGLKPQQAIAIGKVSESRTIQTTLSETKKFEDELKIARATYQAGHPAIANLESQLLSAQDSLDTRIQQTAGNLDAAKSGNLELGQTIGLELMTELVKADLETKSMERQLSSLKSEYQSAIGRTEKLPALEQQQAELVRDLEVARQSYTTLLESYQKALLAENQNLGNARVINAAQASAKPITPRILLNLLTGSFLGILGGAGLSLLLDSRDVRVRTVKDIRDLLPYTLLGTVPIFTKSVKEATSQHEGRASILHVRDQPQSMISETYRMINTNLRFSRSDGLKTIIISSSVPGEGKSTTLANLALGMAELGARVLIIDGDLRRPTQHQLWEIPSRVGFSNLLIDETPLSQLPIIEERHNLHILPAGAIPPNPTVLLHSKACNNCLEKLKEEYDYIFIDAPPLTVASDAVLLGQLSDGLIFISRPEVANRPALGAAQDILSQARQTVLGVIINGVNLKNESSSYYYYSKEYYYGHEKNKVLTKKEINQGT